MSGCLVFVVTLLIVCWRVCMWDVANQICYPSDWSGAGWACSCWPPVTHTCWRKWARFSSLEEWSWIIISLRRVETLTNCWQADFTIKLNLTKIFWDWKNAHHGYLYLHIQFILMFLFCGKYTYSLPGYFCCGISLFIVYRNSDNKALTWGSSFAQMLAEFLFAQIFSAAGACLAIILVLCLSVLLCWCTAGEESHSTMHNTSLGYCQLDRKWICLGCFTVLKDWVGYKDTQLMRMVKSGVMGEMKLSKWLNCFMKSKVLLLWWSETFS